MPKPPNQSTEPPLALAVPLSRFTPQVGGGSAFYVDMAALARELFYATLSVIAG
jgi:hypothetical protein